MNEIDEQPPPKEVPQRNTSRLEEARRLLEEYANDLRDIIRKLRRHLD
jgi:hypothetical protein